MHFVLSIPIVALNSSSIVSKFIVIGSIRYQHQIDLILLAWALAKHRNIVIALILGRIWSLQAFQSYCCVVMISDPSSCSIVLYCCVNLGRWNIAIGIKVLKSVEYRFIWLLLYVTTN